RRVEGDRPSRTRSARAEGRAASLHEPPRERLRAAVRGPAPCARARTLSQCERLGARTRDAAALLRRTRAVPGGTAALTRATDGLTCAKRRSSALSVPRPTRTSRSAR